MAGWFGNLPVKLIAQLNRLVHTALKVMGMREHPTLQQLFEEIVVRQASKPTPHMSYTLNICCIYLIHRYKNSLIPISVDLLNLGHNVGV